MRMLTFSLQAVILLASIGVTFGQSPVNNNFTNRTSISGSAITVDGTLTGATLETQETDSSFPGGLLGAGGSVWWSWTASESTTVLIQMLRDYSAASSSNTALYVYTGTDLSALTLIDTNSFDGPPGRYVAFSTAAGTSYQLRVAGCWGQPFTLKLTATNPPVFFVQPKDCAVSPYGSAFFSSLAGGLRPNGWQSVSAVKYQWNFNGAALAGQTAPSLVIPNVSTNQAGSYSVIASNAGGWTESAAAMLTITQTNPVPALAALMPNSPTLVPFSLTGEVGRWYAIESSKDLLNWGTYPANKVWSTNTVWVKATNATDFLSVRRLGPVHFVRASLNVPTEVCVAQLKQLRAAQNMTFIENRLSAAAQIYLQDLKPYLVLTDVNSLQPCPQGGTYIMGVGTNSPTCTLESRGHKIIDLPQ